MTEIVLDCSVAMSWCFEDEASAESDQVLDLVCEHGAWVPNLWHLEVANVLIIASRKGRITTADAGTRLELLTRLPIKTDGETSTFAFTEIHDLAGELSLTAYDAAYLELAQRKGLRLATKDKSLSKAARKLNVQVI